MRAIINSRLARSQDGFALVIAIGMIAVLTISAAAAIDYATANNTSAHYSTKSNAAGQLAEAGLNNAMSQIFLSTNNPLNPNLLPATTKTYDNGTVTWQGTLDQSQSPQLCPPYPACWTVTSTSTVANPTGYNGKAIKQTLTAKVPVQPVFTQPLINQVWNYVYVYNSGDPSGCDYSQLNNSNMGSPLYVAGNACFDNQATITGGAVQIQGTLTFNNSQNKLGTSGTPVTSGVHIKGGCKLKPATTFHKPCDATDQVYANPAADTTPINLGTPTPDWSTWYLNASPGPYSPCNTQSGTPPTFDNDQGSAADASKENRSVSPGVGISLTPGSSYSCKTAGGELSWNASTKVITIAGTVFIDGNARIDAGGIVTYTGQGSLYLSGSFVLKNTKLCAVVSGTDCDWQLGSGHWDPNTRFLQIVAGDKGGGNQADASATDISIEFTSASFQGGSQAAQRTDIGSSTTTQGPIVTAKLTLNQSLTTYPFPTLTTVPAATPGNPTVYGTPLTPRTFG